MATRPPLTEREAAKYIGMSRSFLAIGRMKGATNRPVHLKAGKAVRYLPDDLDAWLLRHRVVAVRPE